MVSAEFVGACTKDGYMNIIFAFPLKENVPRQARALFLRGIKVRCPLKRELRAFVRSRGDVQQPFLTPSHDTYRMTQSSPILYDTVVRTLMVSRAIT